MNRLLMRKPISLLLSEAGEEEGAHSLRRALGPWSLMALGVGGIIGAGIFVLTGEAAYRHAGPAVILSFVAAGLACVFAALCYAEFASLIPIAGSAYTYGYATLGEVFAWIIGWDLILEYAVGSMTVAIGWSGYFQRILAGFGIHLPLWMTASPAAVQGAVINLPAVIIVLAIMVVLVGSGHVAYGLGAERQARLWSKGRTASIVPVSVREEEGEPLVESVQASYADFVWGLPPLADPLYPVVGLSTPEQKSGERYKVIGVADKSPAAAAGFQVAA